MTTEEQLASVRTAIAAIEGGAQEYRTASGRQVIKARLNDLYNREKDLERKLDGELYGNRMMAAWDNR